MYIINIESPIYHKHTFLYVFCIPYTTALYLIAITTMFFLKGCSLVQWRQVEPLTELNIQIILCGLAFLILPAFTISACFKVSTHFLNKIEYTIKYK